MEFYPLFQSLVDQKKFRKDILIMMEDRILMDKNLPQKYGTQIQNSKLYKIDNIDSVLIRRKNLGINSLEEYLNEMDATY